MEGAAKLPRPSDLSPSLLVFLSDRLGSAADLSGSPELASELRRGCFDLELSLQDLDRRICDCISDHASRSQEVGIRLAGVRAGLICIRSCIAAASTDGGEGEGRRDQILAEELPALAKEVARVESACTYAETALKLDSLIGDVEDAVSSCVTGKLRFPGAVNSEEIHMTATRALKNIEDILISVTKTRPRWASLVLAVDNRVDRALAVLRPQAIADHRSLLASLGWPPPLSGSALELTNPLLTMKGELKSKYCESFLSLCNLQALQTRRKSRQLEGHNREVAIRQPLWVVEELANPITLASQRHFPKWGEKPEFIFALVYKTTRDFVDSMDEVLQPLVDKARLVGYSCREEWISAMVTSLSTYLAKEIFPTYVSNLHDGSSWLHLVDLMISFDKRTQSLITKSRLLLSLREEDESLQRVSSLAVFCDRPDWLEIWAEMELSEVLDKLKSTVQDERVWKTRALMTGSEDYRSPIVSESILHFISSLIERSRALPGNAQRASFVSLVEPPILQEFMDCLLHRCQVAEGLTALADDDALIKVSHCVNATRYCESVLTEWCEDSFFLELESIFEEGIGRLSGFRTEWVEKISTVILRGFDARCREYLKNKKQWQQEKASGGTVAAISKAFLDSLDYLQGKISKLEEELNGIDFVAVWRSVAGGVDQLVAGGVLLSNARFHDGGVEKLSRDLEVLFGVFAAWCLRPEGFFPKLSEGLRLLKMGEGRLEDGRWLRENGVRHLTVSEADKIIKSRVFTV